MRVLWRDPDEFRGGDVLPGGEASTGPRSGERGDSHCPGSLRLKGFTSILRVAPKSRRGSGSVVGVDVS